MVTIFDVSNFFLSKESMSHMKLQKLCYYSQAWSYALRERAMVTDTEFEAWIHGPVSPELYQEYQKYGFADIPQYKGDLYTFTAEELENLESTWETYGDSTGNSLSVLSHGELPWIKARGNYPANAQCSNKIDPKDMIEYYRSIYIGDLTELA
ncbi:MAG: DUF4065 domain-containing protein [Spirochaetaceae bacterium]|jgi:uncharacterized phage-associated protein|nr:DUF4065 domain-containing protein [Spirochaetaceae bacterium]